MKVLIACEESQAVVSQMRALGHEAYSCDIEPCSGGHPEWHVMGDVSPIINGNCSFKTEDGKEHQIEGKWDLLIAHPPCTYLSNAGAPHLFRGHQLNEERYHKGLEAKEFFMKFIEADCDRICVENPTPSRIYELPPYTQAVQPYEHGHPFQKRTCLWLKGLPPLEPTNIMPEDQREPCDRAEWFNKGGKNRQKNRSKTFPGIAKAMAEQWAGEVFTEA